MTLIPKERGAVELNYSRLSHIEMIYSVLIEIAERFKIHHMNANILQLNDEYGARSKGRFASYSHYYVTCCPYQRE